MVTKSRTRPIMAVDRDVEPQNSRQPKKSKAAPKCHRIIYEQDRCGLSPAAEASDRGHDAPRRKIPLGDSESRQKECDQDEGKGGGGEEEDEMDAEVGPGRLYLAAVDDSDTSDSSMEFDEKLDGKTFRPKRSLEVHGKEDEEDNEEWEMEEIPISDIEELDEEDKEDLITHNRLTINNTAALLAAFDRISIPTDDSVPFAFHQSVVASVDTADSVPDVSDDLQRELALYSQCLDATNCGRAKLLAEGVPFSRPKDYFAEMVKQDAHMHKVKAKLVEEASAKKAAAEARKLRDLKKFGKQVQVAKLQERQRAKRETLDKIKTLKRKRQESGADLGTNEADMFDVGVDSEMAKHTERAGKMIQASGARMANAKRQKKNDRYGFGGKKRHHKSGDAISSGDLSEFHPRRMKTAGIKSKGMRGKTPRPGKARRKGLANK